MAFLPISHHIFSVSGRYSCKCEVASFYCPITHFTGLPPPPVPPGEQPFKLNTAGLWMLPSFCRMLWDLIARVFMALHHLCREKEVEARGGWRARIPAWTLSENKDGRHESSLKWKPRYIDPRPVARLRYGLEILLLSSGRLAPEQIKTHWERTSSRVLSKMDSVDTGPLFKSTVRVKSFLDDIYAQPCPNVPLGFAEDGLNKRKQLVSASSLGQNTFFFKAFSWLLPHGSPTSH